MVRHVILWQLKDELSETEKAEIKVGIKSKFTQTVWFLLMPM